MNTDTLAPPQAADAERAILGAVLVCPEFAAEAAATLTREDFLTPAYRLVYDAAMELHARGTPPDVVTVKHALEAHGVLDAVGGVAGVAELLDEYMDPGNAEFYAGIVRDKAIRRRLVQFATDAAQAARHEGADLAEQLEHLQADLYAIAGRATRNHREPTTAEAAETVLAAARAAMGGEPDLRTVPTGFNNLDFAIGGGLGRGHFVVLAAEQGGGKSAFALNVACNVCRQGGRVLYVSAEMDATELMRRALSSEAGLPAWKLRSRQLTPEELAQLEATAATVKRWRLDILAASPTPAEIALRARRLALRWRAPLDLVVVDYLQLMQPAERHENRTRALDALCRELKVLAVDLDVPMLLLSQFNRTGVADRANRPELWHLRDSGSIEQTANLALLLWNPPGVEPGSDGTTTATLRIAKQRNGYTTPWDGPRALRFAWRSDLTTFYQR